MISGTEKVFFIALGESTMAAVYRTEDTEAAAAGAAPGKCEEEGWRRRRGRRGNGGGLCDLD